METYVLMKKQEENYTPAMLICEIAKACGYPIVHAWDRTGVIIRNRSFFYDHWKIEKRPDGYELVTIHLVEA